MSLSNAKGGAFERKVCRALSEWITEGKDADCFWRSSMSGGRATIKLKEGKKVSSQAGDISAIAAAGMQFIEEFSVECKHYKSLEIHRIVYGGKTGVTAFWEQCRHDANEHDKLPFMVAKQNHFPELLFLDVRGVERLRLGGTNLQMRVRSYVCDACIYQFDDFLKEADPREAFPCQPNSW